MAKIAPAKLRKPVHEDAMKIILIVGDTIRAYNTMKHVSGEIKKKSPEHEVCILSILNKKLYAKTLAYKPDVILVGALSTELTINYCYTMKAALKCRILSCMEEGVMQRCNANYIKLFTGNYMYGPHLVDGHIFVGNFQKNILGTALIEEKKCSSRDRCVTAGYIHLEFMEKGMFTEIPQEVHGRLSQYDKKDIYMFLTGFQGTDYGLEEFFRAGDIIDLEKNIEQQAIYHLATNNIRTKNRKQYMEIILHFAQNNPQALIVIKTHPGEEFSFNLEQRGLYAEYVEYFKDTQNIFLLKGNIHIASLLKHVGVMIHYGSSSLIFTYFHNVYSIGFPFYDMDNEQLKERYSLGWRSDVETRIDTLPQALEDYKQGTIKVGDRAHLKKLLHTMYNYSTDEPYAPAAKLAQIILDEKATPMQSIEDSPLDTQYFAKLG